MAYEITATRKRPHNFDELAGQEFVSATLRASIASGRIAHAYLFAGPRGCGKTSTARILAKSLNCERGPTAEPCGVCDSCQSIGRGAALDVIEIDGASNTSVENVRQIKDEVLFPPNASKYKIYIIDEVHMLSNSAFNALLKTIEEPPPYIVFIFATTELHKVPATIKSRCQQFNFRLIQLETILERLKSAAADLGVQAESDALLWIAREATGSLRDAYTLFDQVASFSGGHITAAKIRDKLGLVGSERLGGLMELCVAGDRAGALELLNAIIASGVSVEQFVTDAVAYVRGLLLISCGVEREALLGAPRTAFPAAVTAAIDAPRVERMLAGLFELYRNMRYSVNPRFELELAVARLCSIGDYVPPALLARTVRELKALVVNGAGAGVADAALLALAQKKNDPGLSGPARNAPDSIPAGAGDSMPVDGNLDVAPLAARKAVAASDPDDELLAPDEATLAAGAAPAGAGVDGDGEDAGWLKEKLVALLAKKRLVLSSSLERSTSWRVLDDRLRINCANAYDGNTILAENNLLARKATELSGRALRIDLQVPESATPVIQVQAADDDGDDDDDNFDAVESVQDTGVLPDSAAIVERVFRGKRIGEG